MFSGRCVGRYVGKARRVVVTSACNRCPVRVSLVFALIILILLPAAAHAQASISGTVTDASGAVLPGVTVEASSPALIEKARVVVTDAMGLYRIVDLRPGIYTVTFTLTGFNTFQRQGIELTGSFNASVNAELKVGGLEQQITVTGESPIVDVQNVQQQRVVSTDVINKLPSARTPLTLAALIPGMTSNIQDVGGTNSIGPYMGTIHGGRTDDFLMQVDGFGTGNAYANLSGFSPNMGMAQEMTIDVGGASAAQSAGGVVLNLIPKEGGNRFSGSLFMTGANNSMQGSNFTQRVKDLGLVTASGMKNSYDITPTFGGPVVRDKLWFFVAARSFGYENYVGGMFFNRNAGDLNAWTYVPDSRRPAYNLSQQRSANGRATWQINNRHKVSASFEDQWRCACYNNVSGNIAPEAASEYYYPISIVSAIAWTYPMSNRLLLQAAAAIRREDYEYTQRQAKVPQWVNVIPVTDTFAGLSYRGPLLSAGTNAMFTTATQTIPKFRASLSYVAGAHEFKMGFADQHVSFDDVRNDNRYSLSYTFNNGVPIGLTQRATPYSSSQRSPLDLGVYAQDKWTVKRLTLTGGARFEWYKSSFPDHYFGPGVLVPNRNFTVSGADWWNVKDLVPRLGASYDLFGNGKTALKASANKYVQTLATGPWFFIGNPAGSLATTATRAWNDRFYPAADPQYGNFVPDCDLTNPAANGECGALSNARFGQAIPALTIDPETYRGWGKRGYNWELSTSVQHAVTSRLSVDVGYFRRVYGNLLVVDNRALAPSNYDPYNIVAPIDPRLPTGGGYVVSGLYDLNPGKTVGGIPVDNFQTFANNYGNQYEHWNGVDVNVNARLQKGVLVAGGFSTGRTSTDNCDVVPKLDNPSPLYCHVDTKFLTQVKAFGSYTIPGVDVTVAATVQSIPGPQILANYNVSTAQAATSLGRPLSGNAALATVNIVPPGTMYGERLNQLDLRFGKNVRLGRVRTAANLDVFNALNADTILSQSNAFAIWQRAQSILTARFAKISIQLDF